MGTLPTLSERIAVDLGILAAKPVVRGTRQAAVEFMLGLLAGGQTEADLAAEYPVLERGDILACLSFASIWRMNSMPTPIPAKLAEASRSTGVGSRWREAFG